MANTTKYVYNCDRNHQVVSDTPVDHCLAFVHGKPCPGKLKSVGKDSRKTKDSK